VKRGSVGAYDIMTPNALTLLRSTISESVFIRGSIAKGVAAAGWFRPRAAQN
jgi:hypothetical protein